MGERGVARGIKAADGVGQRAGEPRQVIGQGRRGAGAEMRGRQALAPVPDGFGIRQGGGAQREGGFQRSGHAVGPAPVGDGGGGGGEGAKGGGVGRLFQSLRQAGREGGVLGPAQRQGGPCGVERSGGGGLIVGQHGKKRGQAQRAAFPGRAAGGPDGKVGLGHEGGHVGRVHEDRRRGGQGGGPGTHGRKRGGMGPHDDGRLKVGVTAERGKRRAGGVGQVHPAHRDQHARQPVATRGAGGQGGGAGLCEGGPEEGMARADQTLGSGGRSAS